MTDFYGVYNDFIRCAPGESLGTYKTNSLVFTQEPMPFEDMEDGGAMYVEGNVTYNGIPASRRVDLYILQSRRFLRSTWSDPVTRSLPFQQSKRSGVFCMV